MKKFPERTNIPGWVYLLSNPCFPEYIKIGMTSQTPEIRAQELSKETGVPWSFKVEYAVRTRRMGCLEKAMHERFLKYRLVVPELGRKEFFRINIEIGKLALEELKNRIETEIDNNKKMRCVFDFLEKLQKEIDKAYANKDYALARKIKSDISYLRHSSYSFDVKYTKILKIKKTMSFELLEPQRQQSIEDLQKQLMEIQAKINSIAMRDCK